MVIKDSSTCTGWINADLFQKSDKGGAGRMHIRKILGGNMKTHVAVYEEGLFDLRGAKLF